MTQRKKERAVKMKINNEMQEAVKLETDQNYKESADLLVEREKMATIA